MFTQVKVLPKVLTFSEVKYYIFSAVFVGLTVVTPTIFHQFNLAGPTFLPMHIFVLVAGFLFGWRTGMLVGLLSPLMSYSITHMPPMAILSETVLELAVYGLAVGLLREKGFNIWVALFSAMVLGRLARLALTFDVSFIQISWPGIALQLALIPVIIYLLQRFLFKKGETKI
ncbi:MAG: ECF transporter S component [Candidatus Nealsonbacteria bacterium]